MTEATLSNRTMRIALKIRANSPKPLTLRQSIRRAIWFQEQAQWCAEQFQQIAQEQEQRQQPNE